MLDVYAGSIIVVKFNGAISACIGTLKLGSQYGRKQLRYHASRGFRTIITQLISAINLWQVRSDASTGASATQG